MATTFAWPYSGYSAQPYQLPQPQNVYNVNTKKFRAVVTLASQASGDTIKLFKLPKNTVPVMGILLSDTSLSTATLAIGISGTTGKYRAAATFTATNTPTTFMVATANITTGQVVPLAADEEVIATIATAALPSSGTLIVDMEVAAL